MSLLLTSAAFDNGGPIPSKYTCAGSDVSPPLSWEGVPASAQSLVLIVDDPDAPDPRSPRTTWVHWVLYNLPPDTHALPEGLQSSTLPAGAKEGVNDWHRIGYGGPCPPVGRHRYFFKLYAVDTMLDGMVKPTKAMLEASLHGHVLAESQLVGTFQK